jgi:ATP synthase delta (OSCP) subunit.
VIDGATAQFILPSALITKADLARLVREIEDLDNEFEAQKARNQTEGKPHEGYHMPAISEGLHEFVELNKIDLLDDNVRRELRRRVKRIKDKAPVLHMTFAVEADLPALRQLVEYIRKEFHPQALIEVGLQPSLVGGVYMRTPNRAYDFSIRAKLAENRNIIQQDLDQLLYAIPVVEAPPEEDFALPENEEQG